MSKPYSNRALPSGTILREWRLEEILGVGGFGIVYKARGIYFDELVAIKEYFPSSISEREADDTVVPIDSDAEEVHALGLKKFVEEAKLLWNLSTPSRHPNIVNVRSLFEIHGTAYMVMDFEDGVSLSRMLKKGTRFNERSLLNIVQPIAEGLDRAHRVGVLHRDIKPPNILINPDGRPVLIDFGSARFESAEATSTTVTFHTPPYAAIEQYVKTYAQGPWTDVYALGVVLYECVAGEKPPEVLERMHGGLGTALATGHWPGYSPRFLAAVDAAMTIRPSDRPQSIPEWLALFEGKAAPVRSNTVELDDDEDATRFAVFDKSIVDIVPVAPPTSTVAPGERIETQVPDHPSEVEFKRSGHDTSATKKAKALAQQPTATPASDSQVESATATIAAKPTKAEAKKPAKPPVASGGKSSRSPLLMGGAAVALAVAGVGGWAILHRDNNGSTGAPIAVAPARNVAPGQRVTLADYENLAPGTKTLADDARSAGAPALAVDALAEAGMRLGGLFESLEPLVADRAKSADASARAGDMRTLATAANTQFATALLRDADSRMARANAGIQANGEPAAGLPAVTTMHATVDPAASVTDPNLALALARQALGQWQAVGSAANAAIRQASAAATATAKSKATVLAASESRKAAASALRSAPTKGIVAPAAVAGPVASSTGVSAGKMAQFNAVVDDGRSIARQVIGSNSNASEVAMAKNYDKYLHTLKDSMRGVKSDRDADRLTAQARQTRAYLVYLKH
ncbi:MAG: protein kinase [Sphingomicrobium sp.]